MPDREASSLQVNKPKQKCSQAKISRISKIRKSSFGSLGRMKKNQEIVYHLRYQNVLQSEPENCPHRKAISSKNWSTSN